MSAGTMGRLSIGVTGLQTNQYALNTTAHNLTNTQTQGYSRQQVMLTDRTYNNLGSNAIRENQAGLGVVTAEIKTIRDNFADQGYRIETGREKYYKAQSEAVAELQNYFGELEGRDFNSTLNSLWLSLQELQKEKLLYRDGTDLFGSCQQCEIEPHFLPEKLKRRDRRPDKPYQ